MEVVVRTGGGDRDVEVVLRTPEATLGDLARAVLGRPSDGAVGVAGRRLPASCLVSESGLVDGALLDLDSQRFLPPQPAAPHEVVAVAGLDAGGSWPLAGPTPVGRVGDGVQIAHPTVSREHCTLALDEGTLVVTDTGARNAVVVDDRVLASGQSVRADPLDTVRLGPVDLQVRPRRDADRPGGLDLRRTGTGGAGAFNRPPRPGAAPAAGPVAPPREPAERGAEPFGVAALLGPLVLAAVMVAVTHDPRFALFSALSPVLGVGTWWESRRRRRRGGRRDRARWAVDVAAFAEAVRIAARQERARLRELAPDPAEVLRRAELPSTRLWERRPGAPDFLRLCAGLADPPWQPPLPAGSEPAPAVREVLDAARLVAAPVVVDLSGGGVVGLVGDRAAALAVARSLLCAAAVGSGPADLTVAVFADPGREDDWDWAKWLPHTRRGAAQRWLSADRATSDALLRALAGGAAAGTALVVLDTSVLTTGKAAPARELLARAAAPGGPGVAGLVVAPTADALPAACDSVLTVQADGSARLARLRDGSRVEGVLAAGLSPDRAAVCARSLARFDDPEVATPGAGLPAEVRLLPLLELGHDGTGRAGELDVAAVRERWRAGGPDPGAATPLGVSEHGLFVLDLVRDGAHGLVGGTTGSGKSELLRTLVAGLAASADPDHLTFVLVDYKGGAAFDACARLPHVVGLVTDLDEQLGARALRALEAELHRRERTLRAAGVDSLREHLARSPTEPLPRLVVVVDEFATLAAELPDFVSSLVGIAQRGRTLGVHLLLATQRPSGAVNDNLRANTNLRIALRVQDAADSTDVLGTPVAALLGRDRPGRAYVRLGPGEVVPIQTALVTCVSDDGADEPVAAAPFTFGPQGRAEMREGLRRPGGRTDLARLVDALRAAAAEEGLTAPRRPWPEPLPPRLELAPLVAAADDPEVAVVALADDPAGQRQHPAGWDLRAGGLLLLGVPGSGTTSTLLALALSLAARRAPADLELYALDFGVGDLAVLEALPHTGAVVTAADRERQVRLLRRLRAELDRRRALPRGTPLPRTVLLLDNLGAMRAAYDDIDGLALLDLLTRLHADGPEVGISVAMTADRPAAVPGPVASVTTQRWLFRLADPSDYAAAGLPRTDVPAAVPGRAVLLPLRRQAQVGLPAAGSVPAVAERWAGARRRATAIGVLPGRVTYADLQRAARRDGDVLRLPVGLAESDLAVAELPLHEGEGALVAGPARSGRSAVLQTLALACAEAGLLVVATGGRRSPLSGTVHRWVPPAEPQVLAALARELAAGAAPPGVVLLVDDAESVDDADGALQALLAHPAPGVHVVAAARPDALRAQYSHWTTRLRRSRAGLLLRPDVDLDGDLLGVVLPRRAAVPGGVARGYLVADGSVQLVQAATPAA